MRKKFKHLCFKYKTFFFLSILISSQPNELLALPIKTEILNTKKQIIGLANVYIDYVELQEIDGTQKGKLGFVNIKGGFQIFVVKESGQENLVGSAKNRRIYDNKGTLIGHYDWTTFWSYVYSPRGKKLGKAKCIAFRGICAAGVASFLTGLLDQ